MSAMSGKTLLGRAYGKINLGLSIVGKCTDGLHLLESLIAFTDLHDVVQIECGRGKHSIAYRGTYASDVGFSSDTVTQAVELLEGKLKRKFDVAVTIEKNIPVGAGLGGGSADAAIVLRLLAMLYKLNIGKADLHVIAAHIGCDVHICLENRSCIVKGTGELLFAVPYFEPMPIVLIKPSKALITRAVYQGYKDNFTTPGAVDKYKSMESLIGLRNDLLPAAAAIMPEINEILSVLGKQNGCKLSMMSGSGPACFGIFRNKKERDAAFQVLKKIFTDCLVMKSNLVHRGDSNFVCKEQRLPAYCL